jgi:hypothetical protein
VFEEGVVLASQDCSGAQNFQAAAAGQQTANGHALAMIVYVSNTHFDLSDLIEGRMSAWGVLWWRRLVLVGSFVSF